jgi:hypothetical protein
MMNNMPEMNDQEPPVIKKQKHRGNAWWPLILILIGVVLLVQNLTKEKFTFNWWALFIFIPVFSSLNSAWKDFQENARLNASVRNKLGSAVVIGTVGVILMFGMDWTRFWPLMVIAGGLAMFMGGLSILDAQENTRISAWTGIGAWVGLAGMLVGVGFLGKYMPIDVINNWLGATPKWWAIPVFVAGAGILLNTVVTVARNEWRLNWQSWSTLLISIFVLALGALAWFGLDWNLLFPIVLIACGFMILVGILRKR